MQVEMKELPTISKSRAKLESSLKLSSISESVMYNMDTATTTSRASHLGKYNL